MTPLIIIIYVICGAYMLLNFKHALQMFQQNSYRISRYWKWLSKNTGTAWQLVDLACVFMLFSTLIPIQAAVLIAGLVALTKFFLILKKKYKKPLVFTQRVWRLYIVTGLISVGIALALIFIPGIGSATYPRPMLTLGTIFLLTSFSYLPVILANVILMPVEKFIQQRYINDAKRILRNMPDLNIIGITGSYGKTSTKHYLQRILSEKYDVLITPGSFNTPMGVVRTIREYLKPYNEIFICEMGAKQKKDIKEICDIVHPKSGIITAVGPMHLESFKSIENVQSTKFELADAIPSNGFIVVNNDFEFCANRPVTNTREIRYGITHPEGCDYIATDIRYTSGGTSFKVSGPDGLHLDLHTRLLGEANISDLLAAIVMALQTGVEPDRIRYAVGAIAQVEHRLSMKTTPGGVTIIDDAFNSNPVGSRMAVEVLSHFKDGKRIIVTPGMIELGSQQYELNKNLGQHIGNNVDVAILVGEYNREALREGVESTGFPSDNLHIVATFNDAQAVLSTLLKTGDTILYENDLPDTFK